MNKNLQDGRFRIVSSLLAICLLIGAAFGSDLDLMGTNSVQTQESGTLEKMIVANGNVTMEVDLNRLNGAGASARKSTLTFDAVQDTFFAILVLNGEFRGAVPSSMEITPRGSANVPAALRASYRNLVIEQLPWGGDFELAIRDKKSGFTFFNIQGQEMTYDANQRVLGIQSARLLISPEFAAQLGRTADAGVVVGTLSASTNMMARSGWLTASAARASRSTCRRCEGFRRPDRRKKCATTSSSSAEPSSVPLSPIICARRGFRARSR